MTKALVTPNGLRLGPNALRGTLERMLLRGEVSELRLGQLISGKPLIIAEGRYKPAIALR